MPNTVEKVATKGAAKVGGLTAKAKGLTGVFVVLAEEHKEVAALMKRALSSDSASKRADLWGKLKGELLAHEKAELLEVYSVLRGPAEEIEREHDRDARQLEALIADVEEQPFESVAWREKLESLQQMVEAHVDMEETEYFQKIQETLGKDGSRDIQDRYEREKKRVLRDLGA